MELKCTNSKGEIVLAKKPNYVEFLKRIVNIAFTNESQNFLFQKNVLTSK